MKSVIEQIYHQGQNIIYNALPRALQPGYSFGPHCHRNVEVCMMTEGECDIIVNGENITVRTGEMLVIFPHMLHSFQMRASRPAEFIQIHFQPDLFADAEPEMRQEVKFLSYMADDCSSYLQLPFSRRLRSCAERICEETDAEDEVLNEPLSALYLYEMVFLLSREIAQSYRRIFSIDNPVAVRAVQFISDHMEDRISLSDVAAACKVSNRYLSSVFKDVINITVNDYINIAKVDKAMHCLTESDLTMTQIAEKLGFSSTQYFSTVFKKYTYVTPKEYKCMVGKNI